MKKIIMMLVLFVAPFALQAQTKFHDVEFNEATGPVKSISTSFMGQNIVTTFTQDGKMQREGMTDVVYDADGYIQSAKMGMRGQTMPVTFKWENGKVKSQTMSMMGNELTISFKYDEKGFIKSQIINMGGQEFETPYTDIEYDDHGNWISRKSSVMGQDVVQNRTIEYYE